MDRPSLSVLNDLFRRGFTHIRLPVFHPDFTYGQFYSPDAIVYAEELLAELKKLTEIGYIVTVDLHPDDEFNSLYRAVPQAGYNRLAAIWSHLSSLLSETSPDSVLIELLNEPDTDARTWQSHATALVSSLRQQLPDHSFVVGPHGPMRHESLAGFEPLRDPNLVYAIHYYDPFIFTHQGAEWLDQSDPVRSASGIPFPARADDLQVKELIARLEANWKVEAAEEVRRIFEEPWTEHDVRNAFEKVHHWSLTHGVPVIVNEFGVLTYHSPRRDRLRWLGSVAQMAEENCLGWAHWDFSDGFGIVDPQTRDLDAAAVNELIRRPR
ncbi:MAG: glycoside hydrolase family 5 protein [Roseibium sp.]|uniref:glycoside hydrolase family 5 protein n=1 Tax=Roseibium sp. TaxID=1936156 RepID=UPI002621EADC|nr:cellulase family glycosylhydrolase [Roseibium sp.]MCV0423963.1 glycoside hydrolase family 5 protein [Roseibium sp.]